MGISEDQSGVDDTSMFQIREQLGNMEIHLATTDIEVDAGDSFKLPLDQAAALGVGLASLPTMFRSVTTTINAPTLLQATDKLGNPLDRLCCRDSAMVRECSALLEMQLLALDRLDSIK